MNFKNFGIGVAVASTLLAGAVTVNSPAEAASIAGKTLSFTGAAKLDNPNATTTTFNFADYLLPTGVGNVQNPSSNPVFGSGPLTLQDLSVTKTSANTWGLTGGTVNFITGLTGGQVFKLSAFNLTKFASGNFEAALEGFFDPPGLAGSGYLTAQKGILKWEGSSFSADITAVPTPALLPGLIGMGIASVRKKKKEEVA